MDAEFINLTAENIADEHLCCIIRTKKPHPGVEAKREWLSARLREGHVFRKLNTGDCVFIEYAPLETAWTPVVGENYLYIYCLWVLGAPRGSGYGRALMEYCIADAKAKGKSGICMLGAKKQKSWLSDQSFAEKFGFDVGKTKTVYDVISLVLAVAMSFLFFGWWKFEGIGYGTLINALTNGPMITVLNKLYRKKFEFVRKINLKKEPPEEEK